MTTYFNNANGNIYEVLARYFDDVMLLKTESGNYIVAHWMGDFESAKNDFLEIAYATYKEDNAWTELRLINKEEFKTIYLEV